MFDRDYNKVACAMGTSAAVKSVWQADGCFLLVLRVLCLCYTFILVCLVVVFECSWLGSFFICWLFTRKKNEWSVCSLSKVRRWERKGMKIWCRQICSKQGWKYKTALLQFLSLLHRHWIFCNCFQPVILAALKLFQIVPKRCNSL